MFERKQETQRPLEYPFESLYRPWSWVLSCFNNIAIFAVLFLLVYALFRRARSRGKRKTMYRKVVVKQEEKGSGKVRALVTGGSGCLGGELVRCLIQDGGYIVYSMDLTIPDESKRHPAVTAYLQLNILDTEELEIALRDVAPEVVFHVAGLIPRVDNSSSAIYAVNATGTKNIVEASQKVGVRRLLYTSSVTVVLSRDPKQVLDLADEDAPIPDKPFDAYTGSKAKAEKSVLSSNDTEGLLTCVLRPASIVGPNSILCQDVLKGTVLRLGDGTNKMSIISTEACAKGHILAEKKLREGPRSVAAGRVYNLSGDDTVLYRDFIGYVPDISTGITLWGHPPPKAIPIWLAICLAVVNEAIYYISGWYFTAYLTLKVPEYCCRSYTFSSARAHRELGWEKQPSWQETIKDIAEQYKNCQEKN